MFCGEGITLPTELYLRVGLFMSALTTHVSFRGFRSFWNLLRSLAFGPLDQVLRPVPTEVSNGHIRLPIYLGTPHQTMWSSFPMKQSGSCESSLRRFSHFLQTWASFFAPVPGS